MSSKAERFRIVVERRTNNVLGALRLLGQCSNRRTYEYKDEQVRKIFREIQRELSRAKQAFDENHQRPSFRL